jgi:hypothetical protein
MSMAIEFHCPFCSKTVRTGDEHAGRRAKCPYCHQSIHVPTPSDQIEPLKLAPVDETDEERQERLLAESRELAHRLNREKESAGAEPPRGEVDRASRDVARPKIDVETIVVNYVKAMAGGNLEEADRIVADLRGEKEEADRIISQISMDEMPPAQLDNVPRPVLIGYLKQLHQELQ